MNWWDFTNYGNFRGLSIYHFRLVPVHILRGVFPRPERPFTVFAHDITPFRALPNEKGQHSF